MLIGKTSWEKVAMAIHADTRVYYGSCQERLANTSRALAAPMYLYLWSTNSTLFVRLRTYVER